MPRLPRVPVERRKPIEDMTLVELKAHYKTQADKARVRGVKYRQAQGVKGIYRYSVMVPEAKWDAVDTAVRGILGLSVTIPVLSEDGPPASDGAEP